MIMSRRKAKQLVKYSARRLKKILASLEKPTLTSYIFEGLLYLKTQKKTKYYFIDERIKTQHFKRNLV